MRFRTWAVMAVGLVLAGGCGPSGGQSWQDSHSAGQVFDAGIHAESSMQSFRLKGNGTSTGSPIDVDLTLDGKSNAMGVITQGGIPINFIVVNGHVYVRSQQMWAKIAGSGPAAQALVKKVDDHWVDFTAAGPSSTSAFTQLADPSIVKDCFLQGPHGTLSKKGTTSVDGAQTIEIDDQGDKPGTAKAQFFVRLDAPHYMVRIVSQGNTRPGGPPAPTKCQSGGNTSNTGPESGNGRFDVLDINQPVTITAPAGALDIRNLGG